MPATKKIDIQERKLASENASNEQMNDIFAAISGLGSASTVQTEDNFKTVTNNPEVKEAGNTQVQNVNSKDEKPGYISLVVPNSLKKKWKVYCTQHGMSLTDCIKMGMKLLEDLEQKQAITIDSGFVTYNK